MNPGNLPPLSDSSLLLSRIQNLESKIDRLSELLGDQRVLSAQIAHLTDKIGSMEVRIGSAEKAVGRLWLLITATGTLGGGAGALLQHLAGGG